MSDNKGDLLTVNSLLTNDLNITAVLGVRVPIYYYYLYNEFTKPQKQLFKQGVIGLIESIANTKTKPTGQEKTIILNVNINQNHNEAKVESSVDIRIYTNIRNSLEELYKWLNWIANPATNTNLPPYLKDQAAKQRNKLAYVLQELERMVN